MPRSNILAFAVAASLVVHLALLVAVPGLRVILPVTVESLVEVEIAEPEETEPEPELEQKPEPPPPEPLEPTAPPPAPPISADEVEALSRSLDPSVPLTEAPPPAPPPLRLPRREVGLPEVDSIPWERPPAQEPGPLPQVAFSRPPSPLGPDLKNAEALADTLLAGARPTPAEEQPSQPGPMRRLEIEGPVGIERRVIHEPAPPQVPIRYPADVRIKFWVSPRGTVTRTETLQTADPGLDSAALAYVKAFRFNAMPAGEEQEQWGTIRVKFRLE